MATANSGNRRKNRLIQKFLMLPLRSSDAGTMYPLTMKKTNTPYSPGSKARAIAALTCFSTRKSRWLSTTNSAAIPRSASSQASLRPRAGTGPAGLPGTVPGRVAGAPPGAGAVPGRLEGELPRAGGDGAATAGGTRSRTESLTGRAPDGSGEESDMRRKAT